MNQKSYNGWTNYETWNVKLWIDNDGSLDFWNEQAAEAWKNDKDNAVHDLAEQIKADHQENMPEVTGTYADLLQSALSEVNWEEIAEAIIQDCRDNGDFDDEETEEVEA